MGTILFIFWFGGADAEDGEPAGTWDLAARPASWPLEARLTAWVMPGRPTTWTLEDR